MAVLIAQPNREKLFDMIQSLSADEGGNFVTFKKCTFSPRDFAKLQEKRQEINEQIAHDGKFVWTFYKCRVASAVEWRDDLYFAIRKSGDRYDSFWETDSDALRYKTFDGSDDPLRGHPYFSL